MAFTNSVIAGASAINLLDLLDKFRIWITGTVGWTQHNWSAPGESFLSLEFPGGGSGFEGFINLETLVGVGGEYSLRLWGADSYTAGAKEAPSTQIGAFGGHFFNVHNTAMPYWFYGNARRAIIVAQCGSSWSSCYIGFFNPFAFPSEYPRPYFICGNRYKAALATDADNANSFIAMPGENAATTLFNNVPYITHNMKDGITLGQKVSGVSRTGIWPGMAAPAPPSNANASSNWSHNGFENMRLNAYNESPLFQCQIISADIPHHLGALDGVYQVCGQGRTSGSTLTNGGQTFRLFQNGARNSPGHMMAIEEA